MHAQLNYDSNIEMKQYVIDEFRRSDSKKIQSYIKEKFESSGFDNLYWIPLDPNILTDVQASHTECQPFYFAIEIESERISCELLVRTKNRIKCSCINYATEKQRSWLIDLVDTLLIELSIKI